MVSTSSGDKSSIRQDIFVALALLLLAFIPLGRVILTPGQLVYHGDIDLF